MACKDLAEDRELDPEISKNRRVGVERVGKAPAHWKMRGHTAIKGWINSLSPSGFSLDINATWNYFPFVFMFCLAMVDRKLFRFKECTYFIVTASCSSRCLAHSEHFTILGGWRDGWTPEDKSHNAEMTSSFIAVDILISTCKNQDRPDTVSQKQNTWVQLWNERGLDVLLWGPS